MIFLLFLGCFEQVSMTSGFLTYCCPFLLSVVASILGLMTVVNQYIIDTAPHHRRHPFHLYMGSLESMQQQQHHCLFLGSLLSAGKQLEMLVEVAAEHHLGHEKKWKILAAMEAMKACLRFLILHQNGYKILLSGGEMVPMEEINSMHSGAPRNGRELSIAGSLEVKAAQALAKFGKNAGVSSKPSWAHHRQQNNLEWSEISSDIVSTMPNGLSSVPMSIQKGDPELPDGLVVFGEWIYILRPLVYVLLIRRYGLRSWKPWVASLGLEVSGITTVLVAAFLKDRRQYELIRDGCDPIEQASFSADEIQEIKRRQFLLLLYLVRDPFFYKHTRRWLGSFERVLKPVPLIGLLAGKLLEFSVGIQGRYCYTSGS
ncbi:hypothetical protein KP509_14G038600 [Ceratopteris richardii]|uniref:Peroxisomal membrane protein PEX16 n=1 Tax=Ceratopteris richardii TaxID=49495 RepID=A0A8T2T933_CERRI|nr:hypothetical protein KP509_14G038600 [Ceratopteris richardii]